MEETNKNNDTSKILDKEQSKNYSEFLGEYKNEFKDIKLIKKDLIYKIYRAKKIKDNIKVCLKVFDKHILQKGDYDFFLERIKREEEIVKLCKSEFIVNILRKLETLNNIIFEMDYWDSNFEEIIKKKGGFLNRAFFYQKIFWEILNALKVLNKNQVIHRDIKPSNLFFIADNLATIQKPCVKLGGFDYAIYTKDNTSESVGSYFYAAPEIIKNLEYDEKCDLWSFGITLYELLFEKLPYGRNVTINLIKQSIYYEENFHYKTNNYFINKLFEKLLIVNSKNRINHSQLFEFIISNSNNILQKNELIGSHEVLKSKIDLCQSLEKKKDKIYLNENKFMIKIMDIFEGGYLPDIMDFPNGIIESTKKINNIIYYDENIKFIQTIKQNSIQFEKETLGSFILCCDLKSMEILKEEILKQVKKDKRIIFNLITTGSSCEKIMEFIQKDKIFENCIRNVCVYCMKINDYQHLKIKYPKIHDDIYKNPKDILNFINKYSDTDIKIFPIVKLLAFKEYKDKYKDRHIKISEYYGNIDLKTIISFIKV